MNRLRTLLKKMYEARDTETIVLRAATGKLNEVARRGFINNVNQPTIP